MLYFSNHENIALTIDIRIILINYLKLYKYRDIYFIQIVTLDKNVPFN